MTVYFYDHRFQEAESRKNLQVVARVKDLKQHHGMKYLPKNTKLTAGRNELITRLLPPHRPSHDVKFLGNEGKH